MSPIFLITYDLHDNWGWNINPFDIMGLNDFTWHLNYEDKLYYEFPCKQAK